jgi:hypothetical protein
MTTQQTGASVSRRTALARLGAGGLALALAATAQEATAQDTAPAVLAGHPMVGAWLVAGRLGPSMTIYGPDGTFVDAGLATEAGPNGVAFLSTTVGTWAPISARGIHFTAVQVQADAHGTYLGSVTIDGHPTASADGRTFSDDDPQTMLTIRDAAHKVVQVIAPYRAGAGSAPPRTGVRMGVGAPGFPAGTPTAGTPTS